MSRENIRRIARAVRKKADVENQLYFPIVEFTENILPIFIPDFKFEVATIEEMGNKHGETIPGENLIRIREDIYLRACNDEGRDRLTIAHEVGHLLMHDKDSIALCGLAYGQKLITYENPEWQANAFGGELLAPSYLISGMTVLEVSRPHPQIGLSNNLT